MRLVPARLAVAAVLLSTPAFAQPTFDVSFDGTGWRVERPARSVTSRDPVAIRIRGFNFLRYTLDLDLADKQPDAFAYLTRLWASVLNPAVGDVFGALGADPARGAAAVDLASGARHVYADAQALQRRIDAALAPHTKPGLTDEEARALAAALAGVRDADARLRASYLALQQLVERDDDTFRQAFAGVSKAYYKLAADSYAEVIARSDSFRSLAARTLDGEVRQVGTRDAGTRVTATLTATDPSGARVPVATIHYVSQGRMPLAAHGGLAFSGVPGAPRTFTAFVAWQAFAAGGSADAAAKERPLGLLLSAGTDLDKPGRRVYFGPSIMIFGRFVVTSGAAFIASSADASWFAAASIRLY